VVRSVKRQGEAALGTVVASAASVSGTGAWMVTSVSAFDALSV